MTLEEQTQVTVHPPQPGEAFFRLEVDAPFYADPGPPPSGVQNLWDYEVVEVFLLGDSDHYLEVELCPHGQYLALQLEGRRRLVRRDLDLQFEVTLSQDRRRWQGTATLPLGYLPRGVSRANAYAIHGSGDHRRYEAMHPCTGGEEEPDFHRLEYFMPYDLPKAG